MPYQPLALTHPHDEPVSHTDRAMSTLRLVAILAVYLPVLALATGYRFTLNRLTRTR